MKIIKTLFLLLVTTICNAQVANVDWHDDIESAGETVITITYDLNKLGDESFFNVTVKAKINGRTIDVRSVSGDVGEFTKRGNSKRIKWNIAQDVDEIDGDLEIDVLAVPASQVLDARTTPNPVAGGSNSTPLLAGISSIAGLGGGLIIYGLTKESAASEDYEIYKANTDPDAEVYNNLGITRRELYTEANKKHKGAQALTYGGITVIVAAGAIIVSRLIGNKKMSNSGLSFTPMLDLNTKRTSEISTPLVYGFNLSYQFNRPKNH